MLLEVEVKKKIESVDDSLHKIDQSKLKIRGLCESNFCPGQGHTITVGKLRELELGLLECLQSPFFFLHLILPFLLLPCTSFQLFLHPFTYLPAFVYLDNPIIYT